MGKRKERKGTRAAEMKLGVYAEAYVACKILTRQHHSLGEPRSAGSVVYLHNLRIIAVNILQVGGRIPVGIASVEPAFQQPHVAVYLFSGTLMKHLLGFQTDDTLYLQKSLRLDMLPDGV